jgi:O-Antigen ligase
MTELLQLFAGGGVFFGAAWVLALAIVGCFIFSLFWPRLLPYVLIAILCVYPESSSYGVIDGSGVSEIYVKGTKTLFFSFIDLALFSAWLAAAYMQYWRRASDKVPFAWVMTGFFLVFAGHVVYGFTLDNHTILMDFGGRGVVNVLKQYMLFVVLFSVYASEEAHKARIWGMALLLVLAREIYGMVRYLFLDGDPQNAYANISGTAIKITFWDINDSVLACAVLGYLGYKLLSGGYKEYWQKMGSVGGALLAVSIVVLSARRTGQIGMMLAMLMLYVLLPSGRRWPIFVAAALVISGSIAVTLVRSSDMAVSSMAEKILIDVKTDGSDPRRSRFYELETALETIKDNLIFGVGPSGVFEVQSDYGLEYHKGRYDFVHSGFVHVLLKLGFIGFALFTAFYFLCVRDIYRAAKYSMPLEERARAAAALCGFAAMTPTLMFGTPVGENRTMLVLAFLIALGCWSTNQRSSIDGRQV